MFGKIEKNWKAAIRTLDFGRCLWKRKSDKTQRPITETCREPKVVGLCRKYQEMRLRQLVLLLCLKMSLRKALLLSHVHVTCHTSMTEDEGSKGPFLDNVGEFGNGCILDDDGWFGYWCFDFHVLHQPSNQDLAHEKEATGLVPLGTALLRSRYVFGSLELAVLFLCC